MMKPVYKDVLTSIVASLFMLVVAILGWIALFDFLSPIEQLSALILGVILGVWLSIILNKDWDAIKWKFIHERTNTNTFWDKIAPFGSLLGILTVILLKGRAIHIQHFLGSLGCIALVIASFWSLYQGFVYFWHEWRKKE